MADNKNQVQQTQETAAEMEALKSQLAAAESRASQAEKALEGASARIEAAAAKQERAAVDQLKEQEKVWLTINSSGNDSSAVTVGVNGCAFRILRDKRALVPVSVAKALSDAAYQKAVIKRLPNGQVQTEFKKVQRFSFTVEPAAKDAKAEDV